MGILVTLLNLKYAIFTSNIIQLKLYYDFGYIIKFKICYIYVKYYLMEIILRFWLCYLNYIMILDTLLNLKYAIFTSNIIQWRLYCVFGYTIKFKICYIYVKYYSMEIILRFWLYYLT